MFKRLRYPFAASPNFSARKDARGQTYDVDGVILHYTAGHHSIGWLKNPEAKASAHFLVDRDGTVTQMVELDRSAWHAGQAAMPYKGVMTANPNLFTIGIELENLGLVTEDGHGGFSVVIGNSIVPYHMPAPPVQGSIHFSTGHAVSGWWEPFYEPQIKALEVLLRDINVAYPGVVSNMRGHQEVATPPGRKIDCGPLLDWKRLGRDPATLEVRQVILREAVKA